MVECIYNQSNFPIFVLLITSPLVTERHNFITDYLVATPRWSVDNYVGTVSGGEGVGWEHTDVIVFYALVLSHSHDRWKSLRFRTLERHLQALLILLGMPSLLAWGRIPSSILMSVCTIP